MFGARRALNVLKDSLRLGSDLVLWAVALSPPRWVSFPSLVLYLCMDERSVCVWIVCVGLADRMAWWVGVGAWGGSY